MTEVRNPNDILLELQNNLVYFFDDLIESFPEEEEFVTIRHIIRSKLQPAQIADFFVERIIPESKSIKERQDSFFLEKNTLFSIGPFTSNNFSRLWANEKRLKKENRNVIWRWLDLFIKLSNEYKELQK